ncbi:MAG: phosphoribosyl-ATP diphosphatase [Rhodospirillaceae bacterium]|nr:phosphoribosyl-ATP diphosphatase [Rhodospirillaceae bacterium]|tara:strand:+ start:221 stop:541 length:321 start_codon:yes stop_codon:yes gene_type:complete
MGKSSKKTGKAKHPHTLDALYEVIVSRKKADPDESYTARLFSKGTAKIAQKLGEESVETVIEAMRKDKKLLAEESADLLYHLLVLWADRKVAPEDVWRILEKRRKI